jgi:hypothetical protein
MSRTAAQALHALEPAVLNLVVETQPAQAERATPKRNGALGVQPDLPGLA